MAPPRARNWQSQRTTPRSRIPGTVFHPEPAQTGQTSDAVFIIYYIIDYVSCVLKLCTASGQHATRNRLLSVHILWRPALMCGEPIGSEENQKFSCLRCHVI
jgi:hypothetical protein